MQGHRGANGVQGKSGYDGRKVGNQEDHDCLPIISQGILVWHAVLTPDLRDATACTILRRKK